MSVKNKQSGSVIYLSTVAAMRGFKNSNAPPITAVQQPQSALPLRHLQQSCDEERQFAGENRIVDTDLPQIPQAAPVNDNWFKFTQQEMDDDYQQARFKKQQDHHAGFSFNVGPDGAMNMDFL